MISNRAYSPTGNSVEGQIDVRSDRTPDSFSGDTMENSSAGDDGHKPPVPAGSYPAIVRRDHSPNRIELENVPGYQNIQIHPGNYPRNFKGCFGVGTSHGIDFLGHTRPAMSRINKIVKEDGTHNIRVIVEPLN